MKKISVILFLVSFFVINTKIDALAQCKQQMVYDCATNTKDAIYLRDFNTKLKKSKPDEPSGTKWTVVLNKGTRYRFNLCTPEGASDDVILTLYDSQHPEITGPYSSTKVANPFDFICKKSGMFYVSIRFTDEGEKKKTCAVGILSFVGKNQ
jgi:hypothetical protein